MNMRRWAAVAAILVIGVVLGRTTGTVAQDDKQPPNLEKLAVSFAEAKVKLSQMNLEQMQSLNKKVPGTLIKGMIEQFEQEAALAQQDLEVAKNNPGGDPYKAYIERIRLGLQSAETRAKRALDTYESAPDIVTKKDVERMRQIAIVTDLQLQRGLALEDADPAKQLQWQLEVLGSELDRVRLYTYLLGQNRFGEFAPGL